MGYRTDPALEGLGRAIKALRVEADISRSELAERSGISYSYLAEIENGVKAPSTKVLTIIARALGVAPQDLMARSQMLHEVIGRPAAGRRARLVAGSEAIPPWLAGPVSDGMEAQSPVDGLAEVSRLWRRLSESDREFVLEMMRRLAGG